jgi:hypothetical protein
VELPQFVEGQRVQMISVHGPIRVS